jgi:hypothetical protein
VLALAVLPVLLRALVLLQALVRLSMVLVHCPQSV